MQFNWYVTVRLFKSDLEKIIELCKDWIVELEIRHNKPEIVNIDTFGTIILDKDPEDTPF